jgi:hypothetical protein
MSSCPNHQLESVALDPRYQLQADATAISSAFPEHLRYRLDVVLELAQLEVCPLRPAALARRERGELTFTAREGKRVAFWIDT